MSQVKVYYMGMQDTYNATNSGEDGLVLKSDYDKLEAKLKIATDLVTKLEKQLEVCKAIVQAHAEGGNIDSYGYLLERFGQELEKVEG
jgi:hypothetical protein